ncbi:hypothetical protein AKJ09_02727 [Labilithrix luteola]|uniref:Uncharacterized protein n=1 Tax=Labilithrix luteola TaxID=1391654 RepID=A0A0K1PRA3_9BACT|nr:hypothetical protein [Labilithrix luteola]AKU96063.1 hypothetical protein AKJ09_02727 [Labilithrix luteola]
MSRTIRRRRIALLVGLAVALVATCEVAHAQSSGSAAGSVPSMQPAYTLEVDSDSPDEISYEALAARVQNELGGTVVRPSAGTPTRAAILVRWRTQERKLTVRASHVGGQLVERTVESKGNAAAVQREAVLLAGNLGRDQARELIDELASRAPKPEVEPEPEPEPEEEKLEEPPPSKAARDDGRQPISISFFYPVATNWGRPDVRTSLNLELLYGRIGRLDGMQAGAGVGYASGAVNGVQLNALGQGAQGDVRGLQLSVGGNVALGDLRGWQTTVGINVVGGNMRGLQLSTGVNVALKEVRGLQLTTGVNFARGPTRALQVATGVNMSTGPTQGAQLSSGVNAAEEITGLQLGILNIARHVKGAQIGIVNIAEEVDGAAIGLLSITRTSIHPVVWVGNLNYVNMGVKFTFKYMYTTIALTLGSLESSEVATGGTAALGAHLPLPGRFDVDLEGAYSNVSTKFAYAGTVDNDSAHVRLLPGYVFAPRLRVFAGGGVRIPARFSVGSSSVRPEFVAGVQF